MPSNLIKYSSFTRKSVSLILVNLLILAGLFLILEIGFRLTTETYDDHQRFRLTKPEPYQNAAYFSKAFVDESFRQPGGWKTLPRTNLIIPNDFHGHFFNVENGFRVTTDIPKNTTKKIFIFGGSTAYSSEVPDGYTIASYLQRKLNSAGYTSYQVVNAGVTSVNTNQQVERLRITPTTKNDVVIFYDGVNDVVQGVLYGNAENTIVGNDRSRPLWQKLLSKLAKHSVLARAMLSRMARNYSIHNLDSRISETLSRYRANLDATANIASERGTKFLHFLQPTLFTLAQRHAYEEKLLTHGFIPPQVEKAFNSTYPALEQIVNERAKLGLADYNLTSIFNNLDTPVYFDFCHVNHVGNDAIATAIFASLLKANVLHLVEKNP